MNKCISRVHVFLLWVLSKKKSNHFHSMKRSIQLAKNTKGSIFCEILQVSIWVTKLINVNFCDNHYCDLLFAQAVMAMAINFQYIMQPLYLTCLFRDIVTLSVYCYSFSLQLYSSFFFSFTPSPHTQNIVILCFFHQDDKTRSFAHPLVVFKKTPWSGCWRYDSFLWDLVSLWKTSNQKIFYFKGFATPTKRHNQVRSFPLLYWLAMWAIRNHLVLLTGHFDVLSCHASHSFSHNLAICCSYFAFLFSIVNLNPLEANCTALWVLSPPSLLLVCMQLLLTSECSISSPSS